MKMMRCNTIRTWIGKGEADMDIQDTRGYMICMTTDNEMNDSFLLGINSRKITAHFRSVFFLPAGGFLLWSPNTGFGHSSQSGPLHTHLFECPNRKGRFRLDSCSEPLGWSSGWLFLMIINWMVGGDLGGNSKRAGWQDCSVIWSVKGKEINDRDNHKSDNF